PGEETDELPVEVARHLTQGEQRAQPAGEGELAVARPVEERAHAEAVAREMQRRRVLIGDSEGKLAVQLAQRPVEPALAVEAEQRCRTAPRLEQRPGQADRDAALLRDLRTGTVHRREHPARANRR